MHEETKNGRVYTVYTFEEAKEIAVRPPRYCENCGRELVFGSFYDSSNRFTFKIGCKTCRTSRAISVNEESYEKRMLEYWKKRVFERAEYRCEMSDEKCSGLLHAHHIIPKGLDPSKKYDVENGLCLCEAHHKMIHRFM